MTTNANELTLTRIPLFSMHDIAVIPKGRIGEADENGCRKVVWQWSEKKLYVVCPSCGGIGHYELEESIILGRDLYTGGCIDCEICKVHNFVLLKGAGAIFARSIRKNPETCPRCRNRHHVWSRLRRYTERDSGKKRFYSQSFFACEDCAIGWKDPRSGPVLKETVRMD